MWEQRHPELLSGDESEAIQLLILQHMAWTVARYSMCILNEQLRY